MPWSGQEELERTKARLVREQRQRTFKRQREILSPSDTLYNSDSDSEVEQIHSVSTIKPGSLSKYKRNLCLSVYCVLILTITANLLVWQFLLLRKA
jgi:hypothetical protein